MPKNTFTFTDHELSIVRTGLKLAIASKQRAINTQPDLDVKAVHEKQLPAYIFLLNRITNQELPL